MIIWESSECGPDSETRFLKGSNILAIVQWRCQVSDVGVVRWRCWAVLGGVVCRFVELDAVARFMQ